MFTREASRFTKWKGPDKVLFLFYIYPSSISFIVYCTVIPSRWESVSIPSSGRLIRLSVVGAVRSSVVAVIFCRVLTGSALWLARVQLLGGRIIVISLIEYRLSINQLVINYLKYFNSSLLIKSLKFYTFYITICNYFKTIKRFNLIIYAKTGSFKRFMPFLRIFLDCDL